MAATYDRSQGEAPNVIMPIVIVFLSFAHRADIVRHLPAA